MGGCVHSIPISGSGGLGAHVEEQALDMALYSVSHFTSLHTSLKFWPPEDIKRDIAKLILPRSCSCLLTISGFAVVIVAFVDCSSRCSHDGF